MCWLSVVEAYPTLQANKQYTSIMDGVAGTQNRITAAYGRFIESIQAHNTSIKQILNNFFSEMQGYAKKTYYSANEKTNNLLELILILSFFNKLFTKPNGFYILMKIIIVINNAK